MKIRIAQFVVALCIICSCTACNDEVIMEADHVEESQIVEEIQTVEENQTIEENQSVAESEESEEVEILDPLLLTELAVDPGRAQYCGKSV